MPATAGRFQLSLTFQNNKSCSFSGPIERTGVFERPDLRSVRSWQLSCSRRSQTVACSRDGPATMYQLQPAGCLFRSWPRSRQSRPRQQQRWRLHSAPEPDQPVPPGRDEFPPRPDGYPRREEYPRRDVYQTSDGYGFRPPYQPQPPRSVAEGYCPPDVFDERGASTGTRIGEPGSLHTRVPPSTTGSADMDPLLRPPSEPGVRMDSSGLPPRPDIPPMEDPAHGFIDGFHIAMFFLVLAFGVLFLAAMLCINADINMQNASLTIIHRLSKTVALRQVGIILAVMLLVRKGLEPVIIILRKVFKRDNKPWDSCIEAALLRETYRPLEALFVIAALTSLAENFLPQLIAVPRAVVVNVVRSTLSLSFILACANIVFNIKARVLREWTWELELKGELTRQRRMEALDKLMSVMTLLVGAVMSCQAVGLDVNSVLAIGGVGGLAIGLAGREILENLFTGLIILSSSPFEVGEEVMFTPSTGPKVEGIVLDVGWYRTNIRSFEREIYVIPNSVFSRNVVLNVTRKEKEWRIFEFIGIQVDDFQKLNAVISDMRKVLRQDNRIIQRLHRRVFLDKITTEQVLIYVSVYVEATNRDAFMAVKQDLLMAFVDCCDRNGARLARKRTQVELVMEPDAQSLRLPPSLTSGGPVTTTQDGGPSPTSTRSDFTKLRSYTDLDEERGMPVEALPYQGGHLPPHQAWQQTDFSKPQPPMSEQEFQARSQAQQSQQEQDRIEFERQRALADQQWRERNKKVAADVINKVATSINTAFRLDPPGQGPIGDGNGRQNPYLTASYDEL